MISVSVSRISLYVFVHFHMLFRQSWAEAPVLDSSPEDVTIAAGLNLTLTWNFTTEIVGEDYNIFWKNETHNIGRCQYPYSCDKYVTNSRLTLTEVDRRSFQLGIANISCLDGGYYVLGYETRSNEIKQYILHRVNVSVYSTTVKPSLSHVTITSKNAWDQGGQTPKEINVEGAQSSTQKITNNKEVTTVDVRVERSTRTFLPSSRGMPISSLPLESKEPNALSSYLTFQYLICFCVIVSSIALILAAFALWRTYRLPQALNARDVEQAEGTKTMQGTTGRVYDTIDPIDPSAIKAEPIQHVNNLDNQEQGKPFRYQLQNGLRRANSETHDGSIVMMTSCPGPSVPKRRTQSEYKGGHSVVSVSEETHFSRSQMKKFSLQESNFSSIAECDAETNDSMDEEHTSRLQVLDEAKGDAIRDPFYYPLEKASSGVEKDDDEEEKTGKPSSTNETTAVTNDDPDYHVLEKSSHSHEEGRENGKVTYKVQTNNNDHRKIECDPGYDNLRSSRVPFSRGKDVTSRNYEKIE